jgi:hypothetical protein
VDLAQIPGLSRAERREAAARSAVSPVVAPVVVADPALRNQAVGATRAERRRALEAAPAAAAPLSRREARIATQQSQRRRRGVWLLLRSWWFYALLAMIVGCAYAGWSSANTPAPPTGIVVTDGTQGA